MQFHLEHDFLFKSWNPLSFVTWWTMMLSYAFVYLFQEHRLISRHFHTTILLSALLAKVNCYCIVGKCGAKESESGVKESDLFPESRLSSYSC